MMESPCGVVYPASVSQESKLIFDELVGREKQAAQSSYLPTAFLIRGTLDLPCLEHALNIVVERHGALRTAFLPTPRYSIRERRMYLSFFARTGLFVPGLYQQVVSSQAPLTVTVRSPSEQEGQLANSALQRIAADEAATLLNEAVPPLMRASLVRVKSDEQLLLVLISHLICDGWSIAILERELRAVYGALRAGRPHALPVACSHHQDFLLTEHHRISSGALDQHVHFWHNLWNKAAETEIQHHNLPFAKTPSSQRPVICVTQTLFEPDETARLRRAIVKRRVTPYVFFRTAVAIALHGYTKKPRLCFWANFANRGQPGSEPIVGWCATTHAVWSDIAGDPSCDDFCHQVDHAMRQAQEHEALPLAGLWLRKGVYLRRADTRVNFDLWRDAAGHEHDIVTRVPIPGGREFMDLDIRVQDQGDKFTLRVTYNSTRYDGDGVARLARDIKRIVLHMSDYGACKLSRCIGVSCE